MTRPTGRRPPRPANQEPTQDATHGNEQPQGEQREAPGGPDELLADGATQRPAPHPSLRRPAPPREPKQAHGGAEGLAPKNRSGQGGEAA